jgi:hypothetical protein
MSAITKSVENSANRAEISTWDDCLRLMSCMVILGAIFTLAYIFVRMNAERDTAETTVKTLAVRGLVLVTIMTLLCGVGTITSVGVMPVDNAIVLERLSAKVVDIFAILATMITAIATTMATTITTTATTLATALTTTLTTTIDMFAQSFGELLGALGRVVQSAVIAVWTEVSVQKFMNLVVMGIFLTVFPETFEHFKRMMAKPPK